MDPGQLVSNARTTGQVPIRKLAAEAHVAGSTITRIQAGAVDPSVETLDRIIRAAGFELRIGVVRPVANGQPRLEDLTDAWTTRDGRLRLAWTRWRGFL